MHRSLALICLLATGCHTISRVEESQAVGSTILPTLGSATPRAMTLALTDDARFRFVQPLDCASTERVDLETTVTITTSANLATFIVGVIATGLGTVALARGLGGNGAASDPFIYLGGAMLAGGLPFAIGPWVGTGSEPLPGASRSVERSGSTTPCGQRPVAGTSAELTANGLAIYGTVDDDGYFQVSPYAVVDAFDPKTGSGWDVRGTLHVGGEARPFSGLIQAKQFAAASAAFLANARFDTVIGPMHLVPGLVAGPVRVSLTTIGTEAALRVVSDITNEGPGEAFAVRAMTITDSAELDGRVGYAGHIAKGETRSVEMLIPIPAAIQVKLRGGTLNLAIQLFDGHGTAPVTPIRFSGTILNDVPR